MQKKVSLASCPWPVLPPGPPEQGTKHHPQGHVSHLAAFLPLHSPANAPSSCSRFQAVEIGVGTFALVPARATVGGDKILPVERPVFQPRRLLKKFYKLKCAKTKIPGKKTGAAPAQPLHLAWCRHLRDKAEQRLFPPGER